MKRGDAVFHPCLLRPCLSCLGSSGAVPFWFAPGAWGGPLEDFHEDAEVVEAAFASDPASLMFAGTQAALHMISKHGNVLELLKPSLRRDERVLAAVAEFASGGACRRQEASGLP